MNGILLINKTKDKTSRDMVNELMTILDMKKIGHTGTLDPIATGLLVVCLGKHTKLVNTLAACQKEYIASIKLGIKTDTLDITGKVLDKKECKVSENEIQQIFNSFIGEFKQTIPAYSAKKINGKKLYEYARKGDIITLPANIVNIYSLELLDFKDDVITFKTLVSKGTYIRSLIEEICNRLNAIGTMSSLVRTKQGKFTIEDSFTIDDVKKSKYHLLTAADVLDYKIYNLTKEEYEKVKNGNKMNFLLNDMHIILMYNGKEVAIYKKDGDIYRVEIMLI